MNWSARLRAGMRFSMRTMLAVMLVAAVFFAWFGWRLRKSQRQAHAVAVLQGLGAAYAYDFQTYEYELKGPMNRTVRSVKPVAVAGQSPYPRRLHKLLGVDFLHNVTRVHLETSYRLSEEDIDRLWDALGNLPDLIYLEASGPVTRPGTIQRLRDPRRLQRLALRWANIGDEDLAVLARMPRLAELNLNETPVTDAGMNHVGQTHSLKMVELHHTKISDESLRDIARLSQLRRLRLSGTAIGDEGIRHLRGLESLSDLDLVHTKITDRALDDVASLSFLDRLDLSMTAVTEKGLGRLERLPHLRCLRLEAMTGMPDVLAAIPKLPALEELHGPVLTGDLSRIAQCPKLRVLHSAFQSADAMQQGLKLPPTLEEISGLALNDDTIEELASLPNLKVIYAGDRYSRDPEQMAETQRLRAKLQAVRPTVNVF